MLAIFPEGTRSKTGQLGKLEPGALMMAGKSNAVIVPTAVSGTDIKRCGRLWPKVTVRFGTPVPFPPVGLSKEVLQDLTDKLTADIKALQGVK